MVGCEKTEVIAGVICGLTHMNDLQNCTVLYKIHDMVKRNIAHYQHFDKLPVLIKAILQEEKQYCSQCAKLYDIIRKVS